MNERFLLNDEYTMPTDPDKYFELVEVICNSGKNLTNILIDKKVNRFRMKDIFLRMKRLYGKNNNLEDYKKFKIYWKKIIEFYKEKNYI